ncbi:polyprenyl synthetase family protein [Plantactinospora sp. GCM10030261]|uniref:polyprenyl synthetase family protein n=1 Tax=Plantactinospora sp. GCM10030261 TaxID=3273420 RepID=UPI003617FC2B
MTVAADPGRSGPRPGDPVAASTSTGLASAPRAPASAPPAGDAAAQLRRRFDGAVAAFLDRRVGDPGVPDDLVETVRAFALGGGKRLRPMFCYWGWRAAGRPEQPSLVVAAAALELFHAFALIHDDIMDRSDRRRGIPTLHRHYGDRHAYAGWRGDPETFGTATALLVGNLCLTWSARMFQECGGTPAEVRRGYRVYAAMRTEVIGGQYLDLVRAASVGGGAVGGGAADGAVAGLGPPVGGDPLTGAWTVIRLKTARYTVTRPLQIGAALAGGGPPVLEALAQAGDPLGDAFQLRDDLLGVFGDPALTGKSTVDDLREGKPTVLMTLARAAADERQAARLRLLVGRPDLDAAGAAEVRRIIADTGARDQVEAMIRARAEAALSALTAAPIDATARATLTGLVGAVVDRRH